MWCAWEGQVGDNDPMALRRPEATDAGAGDTDLTIGAPRGPMCTFSFCQSADP